MKLGHCHTCDYWLIHKFTTYDDGSIVDNFKARDGFGFCEKFTRETEAEFGCGFCEESGWNHITKSHKAGAPWQHWEVKACPDCKLEGNDEIGRGSGCKRCAGTGKVRWYDDGFIGEEQTRLHPEQKKRMQLGPPKCVKCERDLDANWVSCPWCGTRTNKPSELEVIGYDPGQVQGTTDEMITKMMAAKAAKRAAEAGDVLQSGGTPPPPPQEQTS